MSGPFAGQAVLVTGGLGFIGSNLVIRLVQEGADVTVLDALIPQHGGDPRNVAPVADRIRVNICDMNNIDILMHLVEGKRYVFHLAGQVSHGDSMREPHLDLEVNCVASLNLVEACRRANLGATVVYTSTRQVYGVAQALPVAETHPTRPIDVNGINKLAAEYYHLLYDKTYGLKSAVLRLTNTYGPRQQILNDRQGFTGIFIRQALRQEPIRLYGTGEQRRDFNYVDDVVDALLAAALHERCHGEVFNLGADTHESLREFVAVLNRHAPVEHRIVPFPADRKIIDIGDYYGDYRRFHALTGWRPRVDLDEGLRRTVAFFQQHREQYL